MNHQKLSERVKRALAGILVVGMVLTGMPALNVEAVNEIPEQTQPEQEVSTSENSVEEPDDGIDESGDIKPEDDDNASGDDQGTKEPQPGTEDEETGPGEEEPVEDEETRPGEEEPAEDEGTRVVGGYIELPEDRDVSVVDESARIYDYEDEIAPLMSDALPPQYIPDMGTLPLTRNQNPYGSCWAHSAMALAEIDMMRNGGASSNVDYSELHLAYFSYNGAVNDPLGGLDGDANYCTEKTFMDRGGNLVLAQNVLANWVGAADESTAPYSQAANALANGLSKEIAFTDVVHLQNSYQINLQENADIAKRMIQKYGAVGTSYYDADKYHNTSSASYYCDTETATNHAVTIVGWDDSFSADNFNTKPEGSGAWLIRNSWYAGQDTDSRSKYTYFWLSYYDKSLAAGFAFDFEDAENYHHNYQYDGGMHTSARVIGSDNIYAANVFTAGAYEGGERLEAVGLTFYKAQTPYKIFIYKNLTDLTDPESGELLEEATTSGTCGCEGFYTIPLINPVSLAKDDTFSVVVQYGAPEKEPNTVYVPYENSVSTWYRCEASAKEGQSFYKLNNTWTDFGVKYNANLRIKAYTMDDDGGTGLPVKIELKDELKEGIEVGVGDTYQATCTVLPRSASDRTVRWESDQPSVATVDQYGLITGVSDGTATITVTCVAAPSLQASFSVEVFSEPRSIQIKGASRVTAGKTLTLQTVCSPSSVAADLQWSSSDERVLTVDADGVVTGVAPGYAAITAGIGEVTATKEITCEFPTFYHTYSTSIEGITLTWSGNPGVKKYEVYRAEGTSWTNPELLETISADGRDTYSYLDKNVEGKKKYTYEVIATIDYIKGNGVEEKTVSSGRYSVTMPEYYFITYHLNGGENSSSNQAFYKAEYSYNYIYSPKSRAGYSFNGWYYDEGLTQKLESGKLPSTMTGDLDLYAGWKPIVYQITYRLNNGTNVADPITSYTIETDTFTLPEPTKAGYRFDGWYTDYAFTKTITEVVKGSIGNLTLYAKWIEVDKKISYELDGGTNAADNPSSYTSTDGYVSLKDPTKKGYDFQGWYKESTYETRVFYLSSSVVKEDLTLYAKWEIHSYRITYILYGGINSAENPETYTVEDAVIILKDAVKAGAVFEGWYSDLTYKEKVTQITPEDERDITLFAKWQGEEIPTNGALELGVLTLSSESLVYTGAEQKPEVTLTLEGVLLVEGRDYTITCHNNKDVGTAMVVAEGIGDYYGSLSHAFVITPAGIRIRAKDKTILIGASIPDDYEYEVSGLLMDDRLITEPVFNCDITEADTQKEGRFTITPSAADAGPNYTITYEEGQLIIASEYFAIEVTEDIYYYTGKAWKPAVNVYDGETMLKAGRDYTVKYCNNINANAGGVWKKGSGQGSDFNPDIPYVQITGKGNYTDEVKVNFDIHPVAIADENGKPAEKVVLKYTDQFVAARKVLKPFGSIKYSKAMKLNQDYTLSLAAVDVRAGSGQSVPSGTKFDDVAIPAGYEGEFVLTVTGIGNYAGSISKSVHVADQLHLMKNAKITLGKNQKNIEFVRGNVKLTPSIEDSADTFTVKIGTTILTPYRDYEVSYLDKSNERVGKATLVVTGAGDYSGTKTAAFTVRGKAFAAGKITVTGIEDKVYTGRAITQNDVVLVYNAGKPDERKLKYGTDYTISYAKNINKGTAAMTFTGLTEAGFSGSFKKSFKISADSIDKVKRTPGWDAIVAEYSKGGAKPVSEIILTNAGGIRLQNGKDYTLSYINNNLVAKAADEKAPTIIVKGKGNYQGSFSIPFTITEADLRTKIENGEITVKTTAVAYQQNKSGDYAYKPAVKLMEGNKPLRLGADYTVTYINNTQADYEAYIEAIGTSGASALEPLAVIGAGSDNTYLISSKPGERPYVEPNEISVPLTIYRNKLTKANLRVEISESECVYTGTQVKPEVAVYYKEGDGWQLLTKGKDYTVSYGANVKSGKKAGRVTISGIGTFYGGDVAVNFEIPRKKIKY